MNLAPKVANGALAGALSVVIIWIVTKYGIVIPPEVASSFTTILTAITAYFSPRSQPPQDP